MAESSEKMETETIAPARRWTARIGWLVLIWCASVAALGAVALGLRLLMRLAGMTT